MPFVGEEEKKKLPNALVRDAISSAAQPTAPQQSGPTSAFSTPTSAPAGASNTQGGTPFVNAANFAPGGQTTQTSAGPFPGMNITNPQYAPGTPTAQPQQQGANSAYQQWLNANGITRPTVRDTMGGGNVAERVKGATDYAIQQQGTPQAQAVRGLIEQYGAPMNAGGLFGSKGVPSNVVNSIMLTGYAADPYSKDTKGEIRLRDVAKRVEMGIRASTQNAINDAKSRGDLKAAEAAQASLEPKLQQARQAFDTYERGMLEGTDGTFGNKEAIVRAELEANAKERAAGINSNFSQAMIGNEGKVTGPGLAMLTGAAMNVAPTATYTGPASQLGGAYADQLGRILQTGQDMSRTGWENYQGITDRSQADISLLRNAALAQQGSNQGILDKLYSGIKTGDTYLGALGRQQAAEASRAQLAGILGGQGGYNPASAEAASMGGAQARANIMSELGTKALAEQEQAAKMGLMANESNTNAFNQLAQAQNQAGQVSNSAYATYADPVLDLLKQSGQITDAGMNFNMGAANQDFNAQMALDQMRIALAFDQMNAAMASNGRPSDFAKGVASIAPIIPFAGGVAQGVAGGVASTARTAATQPTTKG